MARRNVHVVLMDKSKPKPRWIDHGKYGGNFGKSHIRYYQKIWEAQPAWADREEIRAIYKRSSDLRGQGFDVEVDHMVPLRHSLVCGLHNEFNLQILNRIENQNKSNHQWPDGPFQQLDFFK